LQSRVSKEKHAGESAGEEIQSKERRPKIVLSIREGVRENDGRDFVRISRSFTNGRPEEKRKSRGQGDPYRGARAKSQAKGN